MLQDYYSAYREEIPVDRSRDGKTVWSMQQLRSLFNTCRQPGVEKDTLYRHFRTGECVGHRCDCIISTAPCAKKLIF